MPEVKSVDYQLPGGEHKSAVVIPVEFSTDGLSQNELRTLDNISEAVAGFTPIFARQQYNKYLTFIRTMKKVEGTLTDPRERKQMNDYMCVLNGANAPWNNEGKCFVMPFVAQAKRLLPEADRILSGIYILSIDSGLYPEGITEEEFDSLGDKKNIENSIVIRQPNGGLEVVLNEKHFYERIDPILHHLGKALETAEDVRLMHYIKAKMNELMLGDKDSRQESWGRWIDNNGNIDFVMGTAIETYLDKFKGIRGVAQGTVNLTNPEFTDISERLVKLLPKLEELAPWKQKRVFTENQPMHLRYVDVLNSSGAYNSFPLNTIAESLPDDEETIKKYGSANMVFVNLQRAIGKAGELAFVAREFFLPNEMARYQHLMPDMGILMTSMHELGHRTGMIKDNDQKKYFGKKYSLVEEQRAELFSMWGLPLLVREGIITEEQEVAGYYNMLAMIIQKALTSEPIDHSGARNMMFHYLQEKGAWDYPYSENGKIIINPGKVREAVTSLLGKLGDIRAEGELDKFMGLAQQYIRTDKQEIYKRRLSDMPMGRLPIFPEFEKVDGSFTGGLVYPDYRKQRSSIERFL